MLREDVRSMILVAISAIGSILVSLGLFNLVEGDIATLTDLLKEFEVAVATLIGIGMELYAWFSARTGRSGSDAPAELYERPKFLGLFPAV